MANNYIIADKLARNESNVLHVTGTGSKITITTPYGNYAPVLIFGIIANRNCVLMLFPTSTAIDVIYNPQGYTFTKTAGSPYTLTVSASGGWDAYVVGGFSTAVVSV